MLPVPPDRDAHARPLSWPVWAAAVAIVGLGAALRLWGYDAGAPFRMGVDEPVIVSTALRMMRTGDMNPHFFDYGGLTLYLHAAIGAVAFLTGAMQGRWSHLDAIWEGDLLSAGRIVTALLGAFTIVLVFRVGLRWGTAVALIGALALAVLPAHVREAHFILTDTPLTHFVAWALLLSIRATERERVASVALAGVAVGLAAAVKYNGVVALLIPLLAAASLPRGRRLPGIWAATSAAAGTFLLCAPYTVLDLPAFLNGLAYLMQSYNQQRPLLDSMSNYVAYLRNWFTWPGVLPAWIGYGALSIAVAGLLSLLARAATGRQRLVALILFSFPVVHFWFISTQTLQYGRYLMPLAPMLCVGLGAGLVALADRLARPSVRHWWLAGLTLATLAPSTASAISWDREHQRTDHGRTGGAVARDQCASGQPHRDRGQCDSSAAAIPRDANPQADDSIDSGLPARRHLVSDGKLTTNRSRLRRSGRQ